MSWVSRIAIDDTEQADIKAAVADAKNMADLVRNNAGNDEPMFSVVAVENHTRGGTAPRVSEFSQTGEIFKNAPAKKCGFFKVAAVLE